MDITHEVFNQPDPLVNYNLFESNRSLRDALKFNAPGLGIGDMLDSRNWAPDWARPKCKPMRGSPM